MSTTLVTVELEYVAGKKVGVEQVKRYAAWPNANQGVLHEMVKDLGVQVFPSFAEEALNGETIPPGVARGIWGRGHVYHQLRLAEHPATKDVVKEWPTESHLVKEYISRPYELMFWSAEWLTNWVGENMPFGWCRNSRHNEGMDISIALPYVDLPTDFGCYVESELMETHWEDYGKDGCGRDYVYQSTPCLQAIMKDFVVLGGNEEGSVWYDGRAFESADELLERHVGYHSVDCMDCDECVAAHLVDAGNSSPSDEDVEALRKQLERPMYNRNTYLPSKEVFQDVEKRHFHHEQFEWVLEAVDLVEAFNGLYKALKLDKESTKDGLLDTAAFWYEQAIVESSSEEDIQEALRGCNDRELAKIREVFEDVAGLKPEAPIEEVAASIKAYCPTTKTVSDLANAIEPLNLLPGPRYH